MNKFVHFTLTPFEIPFLKPMTFGKKNYISKKGYYLNLYDQNGKMGLAELSVLPHFYPNPLEKEASYLHRHIGKILKKSFDISKINIERPLFNLFEIDQPHSITSPVLFCLESAILSWWKNTYNKSFNKKFNIEKSFYKVPMSGLYIPKENDPLPHLIKEWNKMGINSLKVKVGRLKLETEIKMLKDLNTFSHGSLKLRLDGNKSFEVNDFIELCKILPLKTIEYAEEPLKNIEQWDLAYEKTKVPLALDEGLLDFINNGERPINGLLAWIIKPIFIGGVSKSFELIRLANEKNYQPIISSTFESLVGLKTLALLSHYQNNLKSTSSGLDTFKYMAYDNPWESPKLEAGSLII